MKTMTQSHTPKNGICKVCIIWLLICLCWCELCTSLHRSHSSKFSQLLSSHLLISPQVGGKLRTWRKDIISLFMLDQSTEQQASSTRMQSLVQADADLQRALATAPIAMSERVFLINGWRWHTMSVIRDLNRLLRVMQRSQTTKSNSEQILPAADFVLKFNYQALADIERNLFHPWLLQQLPTHISASYVFKIQDFHLQIEQLSKRVFDDFQVLSRTSAVKSNQQGLSSGNDHTRSSSEVVWHSILMNTKDMIRCAENIQIIQVSPQPPT